MIRRLTSATAANGEPMPFPAWQDTGRVVRSTAELVARYNNLAAAIEAIAMLTPHDDVTEAINIARSAAGAANA